MGHKMTKPTIRIHNAETNEVIDREMTDSEFAQYQAIKIKDQTEQTEAETKETAKTDLLDKLGITAEEAALLLS
jgi:hypothetical protein